MKAFFVLAAILAAASPTQGGSLPAPIAPAATGQLQCYSPDTVRKTCAGLAGYRSGANDTIDSVGVVLISPNPIITMESVSPVEIKAGQVCGKVRTRDIDTAKFSVGGRALDAQQAEPLRQELKLAFKDMFDREICTTYVAEGGAFLAQATLDGAPMVGADQRVIWVSPNDGYKVAP